jgi:exosortase
VPGGLLFAAFIVYFNHMLWSQHRFAAGSADWSHAYFVPFISLWLLWQNRKGLERAQVMTFWPGVLPLILGILSYVFFLMPATSNHFGQGLSMLLALFGVTLLLFGPRVMEYLFFPIAFLACGITVPELIMNRLTGPLQTIASEGAYIMLSVLGVKCDLAGNVITVWDSNLEAHPLNVAEQCSGMRMVIAFIALSVAVALVGTKTWWKRVVMLATGVPVAVFVNVIRVGVLGLLTLWDPRLASGEAHMFVGTLLLFPAFLIYIGILLALHKAVPEVKAEAEPEAKLAGASV